MCGHGVSVRVARVLVDSAGRVLAITLVLSQDLKVGDRYVSACACCRVAGLVPFRVVFVADNVEEVALFEAELLVASGNVPVDGLDDLSRFSGVVLGG